MAIVEQQYRCSCFDPRSSSSFATTHHQGSNQYAIEENIEDNQCASVIVQHRGTNQEKHGKAGKSKTKTAAGGSSCLLDRHLHDPSSTVLSCSPLANHQWPGPAFASACAGSRPCHRSFGLMNEDVGLPLRWLGGTGNKRHDRSAYTGHHKAFIDPLSALSSL
jgi:hypothetical protein